MSLPDARRSVRRPPSHAQRGVVMVIALIALALLLIGGAALVRSVDSSSLLAGNLGFKRDMSNHAERAVVAVRQLMRTGALATEDSRASNQPAANYSAVTLAANSRGVPTLLLKEGALGEAGYSGADIVDDDSGVRIRYVIDRQCAATGAFDLSRCTAGTGAADAGGTDWQRKPGAEGRPVYRVSVRVSGPRDTLAFYQATLVF